ncbi:MAG: 1-phosphofructokinase family hexose kinase [Chitinophagaceae bacterium]
MIVTITMNPAVDKSTSTERLVPEKKLRCEELTVEAGGGGINVSKALKKLGGESLAVFPNGGLNGKILETFLDEQQIRYKSIPIEGETRENVVVTETSTNAQFRFVMPGCELNEEISNAVIETLGALPEKPSIIIASGSLPPGVPDDFYARIATVARQLNAKYIVDTSGTPLQLAAREGVYLLKPNLTELSKMVGKEKLELNEVDDAALEVINSGKCKIIVVSLGPSGALMVTKNGYEHVPAPTVKKNTTVGAGDSMVAGIAWMLTHGKTEREMIRFGVACGTAATMNSGTQLFDLENVHKLYDWINKFADRYKLGFEND